MKDVKDLFSKQATSYAAFRPKYPTALYNFLYSHVKNFNVAWDCAAGAGQATLPLARKFKLVYATDISKELLKKAPEVPNIRYQLERAEKTSFLDDTFDLITVSTALHWFDHKAFFREVIRVAKPGALFAAWAYSLLRTNDVVDKILDYYYTEIVGLYWDAERKFVEEEYKNIFMPLQEIHSPSLSIEANWTRDQFIGFLNSWSSTQNYINKNALNPVDLIKYDLQQAWADGQTIKVRFPLFMRAGIVMK